MQMNTLFEKIVDHEEQVRSFKNWKLCVRWAGYELDEDSWERGQRPRLPGH